MSRRHLPALRQMLKDITSLGYSVSYVPLNAANFGVASSRTRLIMVAAAPGLSLPSWPVPTHSSDDPNLKPLTTLHDAIKDLEWRNSRTIPSTYNENKNRSDFSTPLPNEPLQVPSTYAENLITKGAVFFTHHTTGWSPSAMSTWDVLRTLPDYDEPLSSESI
jgi:site-specific DNA-cytosine methylase